MWPGGWAGPACVGEAAQHAHQVARTVLHLGKVAATELVDDLHAAPY
jgi:hypothetical protein